MKLSVIVPTWNNERLLIQMVNSMTRIGFFDMGDRELIIVNNGKQNCVKDFEHIIAKRSLQVVNCAENRGWEGGLVEGLKVAHGEFICFQNDDVHIPQAQGFFYEELMAPFESELMKDVGIVAPTTTCAAGIQSIFHQNTPVVITEVRMLIFLCVMMKREVLDAVGGVDESLPGGDDIDLSIRMRLAGKKLFVNPNAFLVHHGFQTGNRVKGDSSVDGGWNSEKMTERTNRALIHKHGFRTWMETMGSQVV
jgi:GT2 family glycosyltransferase